ncbi:hypothetical protein FRE64_16955 (plasmid) [Euhalothece natronophila Z-M001]|uniref:Uncharacterized protein n=2 Tax=Euhalothece TaxID=65097 RepID=A0A5B8NT31_9CHRO|nr:hypothetical protein FRE64_16955 [Euhalothece natronophila Z-M001]
MTGSIAPDLYDLTAGGANTVQGTVEQLDKIRLWLDTDDLLKVIDATFNQENLTVTQGSAILEIDANDDGETDSTVT